MKEFMPSAGLQAIAAGEPKPGHALKSGQKGAETAVSSGFSAALFKAGVSVHESLEGQGLSDDARPGADGENLMGGNLLPLAVAAANTGQVEPAQPASGQAVPTTVSASGLSPALPASQHQADSAVPAAASPDLSQLVARTPPLLAGSNPGADNRLQAAGIVPDADRPVAVEVEQTRGQAGIVIPADASIARLQRMLAEAAAGRGTVTTAQVQGRNAGETVDLHIRDLKTESLAGETDQSLTSRLQPAVLKPVAEFAVPRNPLEALTHTVQSVIADGPQLSIARTPLSPPPVSTDALPSTVHSTLSEYLGKPEWGQGMGKQILWMVNQNIGRAEIRLNPANLGPMEVRIDMDNDQVNVAFTSRHAEVRDAVEQALPRLREMLEEKGLSLADTDISRHSFAEQQQAFSDAGADQNGAGADLSFAGGSGHQGEPSGADRTGPGTTTMTGDGLVDYYI